MNTQQAMSLLRRQFPEFEDRSAESAQLCGHFVERPIDVYDLATFVMELHVRADDAQLRSAFVTLENCLATGTAEVHNWACLLLEAIQNVSSWRRRGSEVFARFLGRETRALWDDLKHIRRDSCQLDLGDCSVFKPRFSPGALRAKKPAPWRLLSKEIRHLFPLSF